MNYENVSIKVEFSNSKQKLLTPLSVLVNKSIEFLEYYGDDYLLGKDFYRIIGEGSGEQKFERLIEAAEHESDPFGFFIALIKILERQNSYTIQPVEVNGIVLPYLYVLAILEELIPGYKFISVKSVKQLEKLTNTVIPVPDQPKIKEILDLFPVRLSLHTIRQMRLSSNVAYQYMPFVEELREGGAIHTWVGQFHRGIVEQMYRNRIIFILNMACPVYCRFCFRKHKETRNHRAPTQDHVKTAVQYVKMSPSIKEIVLTGGDPFMNRATLTCAVDGLKDIPHVQTLRIATRSIAYHPYLFYANDSFWLNYLKRKQLELKMRGKRLEIATHFIHPDEISIESLDIISDLTNSGIAVYVQTPLLNGCNDRGAVLAELYRKLRAAGAEMHYLYMPCSPIRGNEIYGTPISTGIGLAAYLRANLSDRAIPRICTATEIGKIDWNISGWAVDIDGDDPRHVWIRTPYTLDYFNEFAPILQLQQIARVNAEGTLDVKFKAEIGDNRLLWGLRVPKTLDQVSPLDQDLVTSNEDTSREALKQMQILALSDQRIPQTLTSKSVEFLYRIHKTRVECDIGMPDERLNDVLAYIENDEAITDVILAAQMDVMRMPARLKALILRLDKCSHVTAIRLRSLAFNYDPDVYSSALLAMLGKLNNIAVTRPTRMEIETQFLHSCEFQKTHKTLAGKLLGKGIAVYANTPVLPHINDDPEEMVQLAYNCREAGLEFHHLYLAGLPLQVNWQEQYPLDISRILDIATMIRRNESGRGVPRFIIRTRLGDVDFGLTSDIMDTGEDGRIFIKLLPFTIDYYRAIDPDYNWPKDVTVAKDGHPVIKVPGLIRTPEFLVD
ncbi:radical SAM protein [bacterium]|nr:radical SAM protein [candidate division CSSED10-310 bacterium]